LCGVLLNRLRKIAQLPHDQFVVTTAFPDNKKYLTTDLLREKRAQPDYLTPEIELLSYEALKQVCYTCLTEKSECLEFFQRSIGQ
jgi:cysteine synthase